MDNMLPTNEFKVPNELNSGQLPIPQNPKTPKCMSEIKKSIKG